MCYSAYTQSRLRESRSWANALLQMTVPKQSLEKIETKKTRPKSGLIKQKGGLRPPIDYNIALSTKRGNISDTSRNSSISVV